MKIRRHHITLFFLLIGQVILAQNPRGYYNSASGKKKEQLKTALHQIIRSHTVLDYGSLWIAFRQTDSREDGNVWDMYSPYTRPFTSYELNREHSFPKSWWGGDRVAAYTDLHHIYPSDANANMAKGNLPLGEVGDTPSFFNGVTTVGNNIFPGYTGVVFEPQDDYKGDFARTYFYMVTCYQDYYNRWRYLYMINPNTYPVLKTWAVNLLLNWHRNDPVSLKELNRNDAVFLLQNNRNPFIDYPQLAENIWGTKMEEEFIIDTSLTEPVLTTPTNETQLQFGAVLTGESRTLTLYLKGANLTGDLSLVLFNNNFDQFSLSSNSIPAALVNTAEGYELEVTYSPTEVSDEHTAGLVIYDGGMEGSINATIFGKSLAPESLTPPVALQATDIKNTGFRANWEIIPIADSYIVEVLAEDNPEPILIIEEIDQNWYSISGLESETSYTYVVKAVVSGLETAPSNVITVNTITGLGPAVYKTHLKVWTASGTIFIHNNSPAPEDISIYDAAGRLLEKATLFPGLRSFDASAGGAYLIDAGDDVRKVVVKGR